MDEPDFGGSKRKLPNLSDTSNYQSNNSKTPHYESPTPERLSVSINEKDKSINNHDKLLENILSESNNNIMNSDNSSVADSGIHHQTAGDEPEAVSNTNRDEFTDDSGLKDEFVDEDDLGFN